MKPFQIVKVTLETYVAFPEGTDWKWIQDALYEKLDIEITEYCKKHTFGNNGTRLWLEDQND